MVVTGFGVISPLGLDWSDTWSGLVQGRSGVGVISDFDVTGIPVQIGGQIKGFDPSAVLPAALVRRTGRTTHLALAAAVAALHDAKLEIEPDAAARVGVIVGSAYPPLRAVIDAHAAFERRGFMGISPYAFTAAGVVGPAAEVALHLGARGPSASLSTACATGATCVGEAMELIRSGRADVVLAGGADDTLTAFELAIAARAKALSRRTGDPERASRPFDRQRDGFVMSAGAGILVLESAGHAERRGARIYGELAGYGATTDAYNLTVPDPAGVAVERALRTALTEASAAPEEVGYVNAHGTGTPLNDTAEIKVIRRVFGEHATTVPVSSTKSMTGHMLGAAGAIEAAVALEVLRSGITPPTVNCDDPEDPAMNFVAHKAQHHQVDVAVSNSFGFGGHNAVLVARRWTGGGDGPVR
ncbi:beta-ketoacyl-[acyl-carrier-protein] synthase family protein [Sinosporangium siamense]|uniref:beta-ketoacyl-[acyl-carrier-protein] synthase family protein n=1 Tax=Sinosporangium siamense TaxID=1367973 RepID=UPI001EF2EE2B|nr:beta-ketoacyl-ACP synthase II [Sinosporangium siamense]